VASVVDLVLITAIVVFWPGSSGAANQFFVLYFPVVFAFALVFTRRVEVAYTALAMVAYTGACLFTGSARFDLGPVDKTIVMRLIVIAAMGFLGNYYFRIQRDRLARATGGGAPALGTMRANLQPALRETRS
jgi:hypothetical protein